MVKETREDSGMQNFKRYVLNVLHGKITDANGQYGFEFMRTTPSTVIMFAWDHKHQQKTQIVLHAKERKPNEKDWENLYPDYKWVFI